MTKTIAFFGASVTQQSPGYVSKIDELSNHTHRIIQRGYGSMHLNDAGVCFIDEIIDEKPDYCFLDWFGTGFIVTDIKSLSKYLDGIIRKLLLNNCIPFFLLLDRSDMCEKRLKLYDLVTQYAVEYNIHCVKLYNNTNVKDLLRDTVHTNENGATYYGEKIYDFFTNNVVSVDVQSTRKIPDENELSAINSINLDVIVHDNIKLKGDFKLMGIYQMIGPFSGICEIDSNGITQRCNIWDQWCHYNRLSMKISTKQRGSYVDIKILNDIFDTTTCKKDINFDTITKHMEIKKIFYIGQMSIDSIDGGKQT